MNEVRTWDRNVEEMGLSGRRLNEERQEEGAERVFYNVMQNNM